MSAKTGKTLKSALKKNVANKTRKNVVIDTEKNQERQFTPDWKKEENERKEQAERVRKNAERTTPPGDDEDIVYVKRSETKTRNPVKKKESPPRPAAPPRPVQENAGPIRAAVRSVFKLFTGRGGSKRNRNKKYKKNKTKTRK
jgi:hypothetical protein